ncbi:MAG TPA: cytochrome c biogenesis protein CcdA [Phycisphaerae bacterium]|jgi:cytochrome c biogenesis protein CcdA|nr:cytochrome c biogenesis protein CcdA [Phycisphaerae bacterium]HPC22404.1 cytochrome c biogenesis protein CcdA [Phycisphaerae bacterium]HRS29045.1 cytochrome c biogenesis protein CcdA [Phycisphaerae bacterium]HRT43304.1 cytochrome c biogenesis protein CcdA [Phycisphaerae bacterium]
MLESFAENLAEIIKTNIWLAPLAALVGGLLTAANPCVLAAAPLMVGYVAGQEKRTVARSFLLSLTFAIGLTITFGLMWFSVWSASSLLPASWWKYIAVVVCLLMGLHLLGVLHIRIPAPTGLQPKQKGFIGALLLGLLFGLISIPCAGPILLALSAVTPLYGLAFGILLLSAYSLGHCGLVLVGGTSIGLVQKLADSKGWTRGTDVLRRLAGVLIAGVGLYLLFS